MAKDSTYLVTGAAGFIGARFSQACLRAGHQVIGVDRESYFASRPEIRGMVLKFKTIVDRDRLWEWLEQERPRLSGVVHLGACTDTGEMDKKFLERVNVEYSRKIWEYCSREKIPLVYASSGATYGDGAFGYDDSEETLSRLVPLNPYGESKQIFDLWALKREREGVHPPCWSGFKFFNIYGYGERHKERMASMVLHWFDQIRATSEARLFKSHRKDFKDGAQKRDFVYVEDLVEVLRFALDKPILRGIFNLGTGQARTFLDLVHAVFKELGQPERVTFFDMPTELRDRYQYFTEARMNRLRQAGYDRPFRSLEEGVRETVRDLLAASANDRGR